MSKAKQRLGAILDVPALRAIPGQDARGGNADGMAQTLREALLLHIRRKYSLQKTAAAAWGVSSPFVSKVLHGRALPTKVMLDDAGIALTKSSIVTLHWGKTPNGAGNRAPD